MQLSGGPHAKNRQEHVPATNLSTRYEMAEDDASNTCLGYNATDCVSLECKVSRPFLKSMEVTKKCAMVVDGLFLYIFACLIYIFLNFIFN